MAIIRVPQDRDTVQLGVDAANPGDIVLVDNGSYKESVIVSKNSIRIVAKEKYGVILESNAVNENAIKLDNTYNVEIFGFIIQNSHRSIWVYRGGYHRIIGNIFQNHNADGIIFEDSTGNFIYQNIIRHNFSVGVLLGWSNPGSTSNWLVENLINDNGGHGVEIWTDIATGNAIINNNIFGNQGEGIFAKGQNTLLYGNYVEHNTSNGVKLLYGNNSIAVNNGIKANLGDGIDISSNQNIAISNLVKKNYGTGIQISGDENIVQGNVIINNKRGNIENNCNNNIFGNETGNL
ncbi:cell surface protein [hydrocarbon metagenome]|uniref:Cell surface protein n=1 Tax=hydrocarbon metagenome TaxID=938273 RepID=A0A0W8E710_9ZZZZ